MTGQNLVTLSTCWTPNHWDSTKPPCQTGNPASNVSPRLYILLERTDYPLLKLWNKAILQPTWAASTKVKPCPQPLLHFTKLMTSPRINLLLLLTAPLSQETKEEGFLHWGLIVLLVSEEEKSGDPVRVVTGTLV